MDGELILRPAICRSLYPIRNSLIIDTIVELPINSQRTDKSWGFLPRFKENPSIQYRSDERAVPPASSILGKSGSILDNDFFLVIRVWGIFVRHVVKEHRVIVEQFGLNLGAGTLHGLGDSTRLDSCFSMSARCPKFTSVVKKIKVLTKFRQAFVLLLAIGARTGWARWSSIPARSLSIHDLGFFLELPQVVLHGVVSHIILIVEASDLGDVDLMTVSANKKEYKSSLRTLQLTDAMKAVRRRS
jgi:hypothetical protein